MDNEAGFWNTGAKGCAMSDDHEPVVVFSGSILEADMMRNILESEQIVAFLRDETLGSLAPFLASPGGSGAVKIVVSRRDEARARQIIEDVEAGVDMGEITDWEAED